MCSDIVVGFTISERDSQKLMPSTSTIGIIAPLLGCKGQGAVTKNGIIPVHPSQEQHLECDVMAIWVGPLSKKVLALAIPQEMISNDPLI